MTPSEQAQAHDANFIAFFNVVAGMTKAGSRATFGSIPVAVTGIRGAFFNGAWVLEPPVRSDLDAALLFLRRTGLPFMLHVRSDLTEAVGPGGARGLANEGTLPCFAIAPGPIRVRQAS